MLFISRGILLKTAGRAISLLTRRSVMKWRWRRAARGIILENWPNIFTRFIEACC